MNIIEAKYGDKDVLNIVKAKCKNNKLLIQAANSLFGDPQVGKIKNLYLKVEINNEIKEYTTPENSFIKLPEEQKSKLGIFYSNNHDRLIYPCIKKSLECIAKASKNKADIITNLWNSLGSDNPFIETISWTQTSSHLNQVLQILQCLYLGKTINTYKYVSFLEHDVLYPEGYFDYEDFDENCICNMNYIGLCKNGFQTKTAQHKPLSQITMKMDFAIKHFESLLPNAILLNSGLVEPSEIGSWNCINSSIHVNHGKHFTSHFSIYSRETTDLDSYWGNKEEYKNLFF